MGREIRRVPEGWQHPVDEKGYIPLHDCTYAEAMRDYETGRKAWEEDQAKDHSISFEDYDGGPPEPKWYRPEWQSEPTCYQIYETVTEGTPVSPVFAGLGELGDWLISEGVSESAARKFAEIGWAPSMSFGRGGIKVTYETLADWA